MPPASNQVTEAAREHLIAELAHEIKDNRVLDAIRRVHREEFVPPHSARSAYENMPIPIGFGQTISQPLMVAMMTQALQLEGSEKVLEVGTGSGYQAAVLSHLAREVVSVERVPELAQAASERLARLGYDKVRVYEAGDVLGRPEDAPYDATIVTAASPEVPRLLLQQLEVGGRLVLPVGSRDLQELVRIVKAPGGAQRHNLGPCRFVPLLGRDAWPERG
ncbi:MAG TPA: protein-L-isoaspartate(D-aspartate) O-methyltransferase [Dehalococcoidia bacterium]|nr:protein-L-isoaspartate(D-aspartate) O-methyltransferase [Dehalococcoidia bacterium]